MAKQENDEQDNDETKCQKMRKDSSAEKGIAIPCKTLWRGGTSNVFKKIQ